VSPGSHAGYEYSGKCAAWAYKCLDLSKAKRVFVLGPSHTFYLEGVAATKFEKYATPFGDLTVDQEIIAELQSSADIPFIPIANDKEEHSLEMHMPYLYKRMQQTFPSTDDFPTIVPMLIGDNEVKSEKEVGRMLAPYLKNPDNAFIVSSDFCHWGSKFKYMPYTATGSVDTLRRLNINSRRPAGPPIHETVKLVDDLAIAAIKTGSHDEFYDNLLQTGNTVCGRHPIGVTMAALEVLAKEDSECGGGDKEKYKFNFVHYARSELVDRPHHMSVSYVSAYAIV
jgi:MEMO1 family protein